MAKWIFVGPEWYSRHGSCRRLYTLSPSLSLSSLLRAASSPGRYSAAASTRSVTTCGLARIAYRVCRTTDTECNFSDRIYLSCSYYRCIAQRRPRGESGKRLKILFCCAPRRSLVDDDDDDGDHDDDDDDDDGDHDDDDDDSGTESRVRLTGAEREYGRRRKSIKHVTFSGGVSTCRSESTLCVVFSLPLARTPEPGFQTLDDDDGNKGRAPTTSSARADVWRETAFFFFLKYHRYSGDDDIYRLMTSIYRWF